MKFKRRSLRLTGYDYTQQGMYFVTICTFNRKCLFGDIVDGQMCLNEYGRIVGKEWLKTSEIRSNVQLDSFVVMPNHIHGIIILMNVGATRRVAPTTKRPMGPPQGSLGAIIGQFKSIVTKYINKSSEIKMASVWHRNYYEHIIRDEINLNRIREYIHTNPLHWNKDKNNPNNIVSENKQ